MNIRTVTNPISPVEKQGPEEAKEVRTDHSHQDRDPDGRREKEEKKEQDLSPLSEEEKEAIEKHLKELPGFKDHDLIFSIEKSGDRQFFVIKDHLGHTVRRVPDYEMRDLIDNKDRKSGYLLNKAG